MRLTNVLVVVCCIFLVKTREGSSIKLGIFGGGVLVGLGRAIRNATRRNADTGPVLVRSSSVDDPEIAADYLTDFDSGTQFEYSYDYEPIDLNNSYDYDTAVDSGQANASEGVAGADSTNPQSNLHEESFRDESIPDFSATPAIPEPDYDYNGALDDTPTVDDASATSGSGGTRPATAEDEVNARQQFNLTVPDYSSNPLPDASESPPINLQEIFSGIISFTTEEPQPIYESVIYNADYPHSDIENPEYVPDLESEDTFNPKYGLGTTEGAVVTSSTAQTSAITTTTVMPTLSTSTSISVTPPTPQLQPILPQRTVPIQRAKLIAWYRFSDPVRGHVFAHSFVRNDKSLGGSGHKHSIGAHPNRKSNSSALLRQTSRRRRQTSRRRRQTLPKLSQRQGGRSTPHQRRKHTSGGNPGNIRNKRTVTERKLSKSKKLVDGYLPRGVGIDLRLRDRLYAENESKSASGKGVTKLIANVSHRIS